MQVVKSGTVEELIEILTSPENVEAELLKIFLIMYRSFCSPCHLLKLLINRFNVSTPKIYQQLKECSIRSLKGSPNSDYYYSVLDDDSETVADEHKRLLEDYQRFCEDVRDPIKKKVLQLINCWVCYHYYDFERDEKLLFSLREFLNNEHLDVKLSTLQMIWCTNIKKSIARGQRETLYEDVGAVAALTRMMNKRPTTRSETKILWHIAQPKAVKTYGLLTLHPVEIARQLTLLQFHYYRKIKPIELVDAAWTKAEKYQKSPQLLKMVGHCTKLTYWVSKIIVETKSMNERVSLISRILEIMKALEELKNFNAVVAFYSALQCSSVYRLRATYRRLSKENNALLDGYKNLCAPHWEKMLKRLRGCRPPCIPFLGTYMTQILFCEAGRGINVKTNDLPASVMDEDMVIVAKCKRVAQVIREIQTYQSKSYRMTIEPSIIEFFENICPYNGSVEEFEAYLFAKSLEIEPRIAKPVDKKPLHSAAALKSPTAKVFKFDPLRRS